LFSGACLPQESTGSAAGREGVREADKVGAGFSPRSLRAHSEE